MSNNVPSKPISRYRRLKAWDYSRGASLFITISTEPRRALFGRVVGGAMQLSPLGRIVDEALAAIPRYNPGVLLFERVVMPDHVHFNVHLQAGLDKPLFVLGNAIRRFKNHVRARASTARASSLSQAGSVCQAGSPSQAGSPCAASEEARAVLVQSRTHLTTIVKSKLNNVGSPGWQQGYHDRLCLSRSFIEATGRYIAYNPLKWELMHNMPGALRVHEPLDSPRLDPGEYWKGVGNIALLDPQRKLLSLRVTRRLVSPAAIAPVVARMEKAVANGYVIISGFISPGEKAVRDMLCANKAASFIRMLPSRISNTRAYKPESRYVAAFAEGRYLEIARGNEEVEFGRPACLDLNEEIIRIARAGEGLTVYWRR